MKKTIFKFGVLLIFGILFLSFKINIVHAASRVWDGGGGDNNWSTCANWDGPDTCPVAGDTVTFNATSTKNSTVDAGFGGSIGVININSGYTGTITVSRTLTITISYSQADGTFDGSNQTIANNGTFSLTAGAYTASSATTTVGGNFTISGTPTFSANGGTFNFGLGGASLSCNNVTFNAVNFTGQTGTKTVNSDCSLPLGSAPTIPTSLTLNGTLSGSGTLSANNTFTINTGGVLSGFSGLTGANLSLSIVGATVNFGSYNPVTLGNSFSLTAGGNFTAPSGTMSLPGNFTTAAGTTFNANGGTINFNSGAGATITCNGATFNLVSFAGQVSTYTVANGCILPLGNNPTLPLGLSLSGTISGTGTLTETGGTLQFNATGAITGFTGITGTSNSMTIQGGTVDFSNYTTFFLGQSLTLNVGSFTAPTGIMNIVKSITISAGTTYNNNGGTINWPGAGAGASDCNGSNLNNVTFIGQTGTKSFARCSFSLGANPTIPNSLTLSNSGTITGSGTITMTTGTLNIGGVVTLSGFTGLTGTSNSLTAQNVAANFGSYSPFVIGGSLAISNGSTIFTAPSGTMTIGGNFAHTLGTFNANGGTVVLNGVNQIISGVNTFNNLTKNVTSAATLTFPSAITTMVTGALNLQGSGADKLSLRSSVNGSAWKINPQGSRALSSLDVKDSNNINTTTMICGNNCIDSGNNTNWSFFTNPITLSLDAPVAGAYISDERPAFRWQAAVDTSGATLSKYKLEINNGPGSSFVLDNIHVDGNDYVQDGFVVVYQNFTDSDPNNNYVQVTTRSSNTWDASQNDGKLTDGIKSFQVTVYDSAGNVLSFSRGFFVDRSGPQIENFVINGTTISGRITDYLSGFPSSASGPFSLNFFSSSPSLDQTIYSNPTYWSLNNSLITNNTNNISDKYSLFIYTIPISGVYQITLTAKDLAGNITLFTKMLGAITSSTPVPNSNPQATSNEPTPAPIPLPTQVPVPIENPKDVLALITSEFDLLNQILVALTPVVIVGILLLASFATPMDANTSEQKRNTILIITQKILGIVNKLGNIIFWPFLFLSALLFVTNVTLLNGSILGIYTLIYVSKIRSTP
ncbi:MAG TPA: hypothetical protein VLE44_00575 [Candidatus Saccharimonadales bacterium]|nr:hypothetical protein [Candidatus Saccharimonadales bacterium]